MTFERLDPITRAQEELFRRLASSLIGRRVIGARYRNLHGSRSDGAASAELHEVDMDVVIVLDDGTRVAVAWAMRGLVEGIGVRMAGDVAGDLTGDETDASAMPGWQRLARGTIEAVAAAWHIPNEGCPETLWALRLSASGGHSVTIALGEIEDLGIRYQPTALVVFFDEAAARAYGQPGSQDGAFGSVVAR